MEATYRGVNWGTEAETTGLACLQNFDPAPYAAGPSRPKFIGDTNEVLACGMLKAMLDAHRMVWAAQLRYDLRTGHITAEAAPSFVELLSGVPNPVGSAETRDKVREFCAGDAVLSDVPALYDVVCFEVLQALRSSRPIDEPSSKGSSLAAVEAQLGALPAVAIVLLGVAALAGATYFGAEATESIAKSWSAVEIEKAWAVNKAWAEVQIATQSIAAGQTYKMSDWAAARAAVATASQTSWAPLALGGALALVIGGAAYFLREKPHAAHRQNPAHFVPRRRKVRRKKNAAKPGIAKRRKNPNGLQRKNPKRNPPLPRKKKSARKDARKKSARPSGKFMASQRAKGRTEAQARAAWKLSHRGKKGKRGKR